MPADDPPFDTGMPLAPRWRSPRVVNYGSPPADDPPSDCLCGDPARPDWDHGPRSCASHELVRIRLGVHPRHLYEARIMLAAYDSPLAPDTVRADALAWLHHHVHVMPDG